MYDIHVYMTKLQKHQSPQQLAARGGEGGKVGGRRQEQVGRKEERK
jgi:hypothetical protein